MQQIWQAEEIGVVCSAAVQKPYLQSTKAATGSPAGNRAGST